MNDSTPIAAHPENGTTTVPAELGSLPPPEPRGTGFTLDRVVRLGLTLAVLAGVVWALWFFARLVVFLVVGVVLSYLMRPLVDRAQGVGLARVPAILVAFVVVFGAISLLLTYLVPFVATQISELSQELSPEAIARVAASLEQRLIAIFPPLQEGVLTDGMNRAFETLFQEGRMSDMLGSMVDLFANLFYAVLVIPFVTFFMLKDGTLIRGWLLHLVPNRYFEVTLSVIEKIETNIGRYFRALLVQCTSVASVASVLLWLVGLENALAVGLFAGLANTIPYLGPLMGFLAGTVVGVLQTGDLSLVPAVFVAMALTQLADNVVFQPFIFSRAARTHPLVILFVVLIGAQLAGIVGMLLAIPLTATIRVTVEQVLWSARNYRILRTAR